MVADSIRSANDCIQVARTGRPLEWLREPSRLHAEFLRGTGWSFVLLVLGTACGLALQLLLATLMGAQEYGVYIYAMAWLNLLAVVSRQGYDAVVVRFVAGYRATQDWGRLRGVLRHSTTLVLASSLIVAVVAMTSIGLCRPAWAARHSALLWLSALLLPPLALLGYSQSLLRAFKQAAKAMLPESVARQVLLGGFVLAVAWFASTSSSGVDAYQVLSCNVVATLMALALSCGWVRRSIPVETERTAATYDRGAWRQASLPLLAIGGLNLALTQLDVFMLGLLIDTESAGIYSLASRLAGLTTFGLLAANMMIAPLISELYATQQSIALQRLLKFSARCVTAFLAVTGVMLVICGRHVLGWFGNEFSDGYAPLLVLLAGHAVNAVTGSVGFLLTMTGRERDMVRILAIAVVLDALLNGLLIPRWGMIGAAISTSVATCFWNAAMVECAVRRLRINPTLLGGT